MRAAANESAAIYASMPETGPGSRAQGAVPTARTPVTDTLLAELIASYGPSEGTGTAVATPALVDPVAGKKLPTGDPGAYAPIGRGGSGIGRY